MSGDQTAYLIWTLLALTLPLMALIARRQEWSQMIQLALVWAAIFIIGVVIARLFFA